MALAYGIGQSQFLLAGRLVSVAVGLGSLLLFFKIGQELTNRRIGLIMALLYVAVPFALWYDRLAVKDGLILFWASWLFYLSLRLAKTGKWRFAILASGVLGLALLTKSIAYFFIGLFPLTVLFLGLGQAGLVRSKKSRSFLLQIGLVLGIAGLFQSLLYLSPLRSNIGPKNEVFLLSFRQLLDLPVQLWRNNLYSTIIWWWQFYRLPLLAMGAVGAGALWLKRRFGLLLVLASWILLPIGFEILRAKIYIPRYFLFTLLPWSVFVASGVDWVLKKLRSVWLQGAMFGLILFPSLVLDWQMLFRVEQVKLPQVERWQYVEGWPAGYGLTDLAAWVEEKTGQGPILLVTEQETLVSSGLPLYLAKGSGWELERRLALEGSWGEFPQDLLDESRPVFLIIHYRESLPADWPVQEVGRLKRFDPKRFFVIYQMVPQAP
jgi:4-amino-4-deoxy-L-arabinose transferase-like glycosyltransferase